MKKIIVLSCIIIMLGCSAQKNQSVSMNESIGFDKQGHRGSRGLLPENTWPAMRLALDLGVTTLEMDAVITQDKKVVLSHEPYFNHTITTKPDGKNVSANEEKELNIFQMPYEKVKTFDVGLRGNPRFPQQEKIKANKPLLSDVIDEVKEYMKTNRRPFPYFNIETKSSPSGDNKFHPEPKEFVDLIMQVIDDKKIRDKVTIQSFDFRTLQYLHAQYPDVHTALLIEQNDKRNLDQQLKDLGFVPTIYSPAYQLVNATLIDACRSKNIKVIPWTVNDLEKMKELKSLGVDGIISDYPNLFNQLQ